MQALISTFMGPRQVPRKRLFSPEFGVTLEMIDTREERFLLRRDDHIDTPTFFASRSDVVFDDSDGIYFKVAGERKEGPPINQHQLFDLATQYMREHLQQEPTGFSFTRIQDSYAYGGADDELLPDEFQDNTPVHPVIEELLRKSAGL